MTTFLLNVVTVLVTQAAMSRSQTAATFQAEPLPVPAPSLAAQAPQSPYAGQFNGAGAQTENPRKKFAQQSGSEMLPNQEPRPYPIVTQPVLPISTDAPEVQSEPESATSDKNEALGGVKPFAEQLVAVPANESAMISQATGGSNGVKPGLLRVLHYLIHMVNLNHSVTHTYKIHGKPKLGHHHHGGGGHHKDGEQKTSDETGPIILGAVIAGTLVIILCVVTAIAIVVYQRRKKQNRSQLELPIQKPSLKTDSSKGSKPKTQSSSKSNSQKEANPRFR